MTMMRRMGMMMTLMPTHYLILMITRTNALQHPLPNLLPPKMFLPRLNLSPSIPLMKMIGVMSGVTMKKKMILIILTMIIQI